MEQKHPHPEIKIEVNQLDEKKKKSMLNRVIVGIALAIIGIPCIILGGWFFFALLMAVAFFATYEIVKAPQKKFPWYIWVFTYFLTFAIILWAGLKTNLQLYIIAKEAGTTFHPTLEQCFPRISISVYALAVSFGFYVLCSILYKDFTWHDVTYFFAMTFLVGIGIQAFAVLRYVPFSAKWDAGVDIASGTFKYGHSVALIAIVVAGTFLNDIFAYFVGIFFGKHKFNERISPNKTVEGFFGGVILSTIVTYGAVLILDACGISLMPGMAIFSGKQAWWRTLIMVFGIPLIGVLGDLAFSSIKRFFGFKDYSHILGAHGGILDRIDSLIFTAIFASIFTIFTMNGWNFLG